MRMDSAEIQLSLQQRFKGYDRIMGSISWLLIALVALDIKLMPTDHSSLVFLALLCLLLFFYNMNARYGLFCNRHSQFKTFIDLMVFLAFIIAVCWYTGRITSPFISLIYLVLMATALTQGRRITYLMAGLAITSYILLASDELRDFYNLSRILELFPYMLIAHLGAMLAGETESARREVEHLSLTDEVTGMHNMRNFFLLSDVQEKLAKRHDRGFAICMLDADNLKAINDEHGHLAGTELIRQVAAMISSTIRCSDICARYGGDEFVILFNETSKEDVAPTVERILSGMATTPFPFGSEYLTTTISAGLADFPADGSDVKSVMANADTAMYASKRSGKNRLTLYTSPAPAT
ncbi:GGDEF domain-containing protein [Pelobacter propionicus]|uniref:diguanylate cyclase n=1 Tax=Pelobacter propionicus (strain DSM 2379 / NBRC 103807 / OttBd1) TaxID=338966 RepID=A1ALA3_PELPD|nr:GGDEF domain-containing protein [Pelobacter propionicus]ABK98123.1 diguanylate cyclase [Pelobacter propionicus DSM 2379]